MQPATMSNETIAQKLMPSVVFTLATERYVDSVGRSDIYAVSASWWLEEMKADISIAKVVFADELMTALADPKTDFILLTEPHRITKPQLYNLLKTSSLRNTVFVEI